MPPSGETASPESLKRPEAETGRRSQGGLTPCHLRFLDKGGSDVCQTWHSSPADCSATRLPITSSCFYLEDLDLYEPLSQHQT